MITTTAVDGLFNNGQVTPMEEDEALVWSVGDKEEEEEMHLKHKIAKRAKVVSNQQEASNKEEEVRREPQVSSCFVHNLESKGEGLLPYVCKDLAHGDVFLHDLYKEIDCEEIVSEKSIVAFVPSERQIVDQFLFLFVDDLEMGDASSPLLQFDEGLEMGDSSSGLELVSGSGSGYNFANSWETVSNQDEFLKVFGCHAINSLWLFLFEGKMLRSRIWFILETKFFGVSNLPLLQAHEEEDPLMDSVKDKVSFEVEEEEDWGFDEPICDIEATMQVNVDKAMERIAASRDTKPHDSHGVINKDLDVLLYTVNASSLLIPLTQLVGYGMFCRLSKSLFKGFFIAWKSCLS